LRLRRRRKEEEEKEEHGDDDDGDGDDDGNSSSSLYCNAFEDEDDDENIDSFINMLMNNDINLLQKKELTQDLKRKGNISTECMKCCVM
jgi:hypothetical protein